MATPGGLLRAHIVTRAIVGARVFRDNAPAGATLPYVTFRDPMSDAPSISGDGRTLIRSRMMSWDLWQRAAAESDVLLEQLEAALDGVRLPLLRFASPTRLVGTARVPDPEGLLVHHALTVTVQHARPAT